MDSIPNGFAYRCLPLVMGNQAGWVIRCPASFEVVWSGGPGLDATAIHVDVGCERYRPVILSHFGHGIITFSLPWLFRTSPGLGLLVRGPTNQWKFNCTALDAFVETDWAPFTFTMNWKIQAPGIPVRFEKNEPVCQILPYPMDLAESCATRVGRISDEPELKQSYDAWRQSREHFNKRPDRTAEEWQKDYLRGRGPSGIAPIAHRTNLKLKPMAQPSPAADQPDGGGPQPA